LDLTSEGQMITLYRSCCQFINYGSVDILAMYYPTNEEIDNPLSYAKSLRKIMADHLGVVLTDHTYEDYLLRKEAKKSNINVDHLVTYTIAETLGIHHSLILKAVKIFRSHGKQKKGYYTCDSFYDFFGVQQISDERVKHMVNVLFRSADTNKDGKIEIAEFITLLACMMCSKNIEYMVSLLFECLDFGDTGRINKYQLQQFIDDYKCHDVVKNSIQEIHGMLFPVDENITSVQFDNFYSKLSTNYQLLRSINSYIFKNIAQIKDWSTFESRFN